MPTLIALHEATFSGKPSTVDRDKGIIFGVKVIGTDSSRGYRYPLETLQDAVTRKLYEGVKVNVDHLLESGALRPAEDRFGQLMNARFESDGIYADLHYLKSHPLAERVAEAAERMPGAFGFSHHAFGQPISRNGEKVVPRIERVASVDLVADPATNSGLFEGESMSKQKVKIRPILEAAFPKTKRLLEQMEDVVPADAMMEEPPAELSSDDQAVEALVGLIRAALVEKDFDKANEVLKAFKKLMGEPAAVTTPEAEHEGEMTDEEKKKKEEEKAAVESAANKLSPELTKLKADLAAMQRKDKARELCEAASVKPSKALLAALVNLDEDNAKALIEEQSANIAPAFPTSQGRAPVTSDDFEASYRSVITKLTGRAPAKTN